MLTRRHLLATSASALALAVGCSTAEPTPEVAEATPAPPEAAAAEPPRFDPDVLAKRLADGEDIFLLDVRTPEELEEHGLIEGAVNIPIDQLEARLAEVPKDRPVAVY